ncbi:hypothetical protein BN7_6386 [Wickerhamomyces ciferrii]|uniref:ubiquitinyl hydrolase 1 n=1 Tax=Wickerhamomyces ciferrii (strain ATCC 14091 / BCRC 22168 / CBS 111 / JCM 3599 / NBRC 0793 / NRRL Y-1031 F-60-10) TaxID=1206466 RepID=K0KXN1_WICCF|nr:uncharacterized protein BN7_6386 [Wickerhamomyces ciferrii]CCH46787.1 hypothetical protein BN7_6386 [Wickerhamomyces ciferrii]
MPTLDPAVNLGYTPEYSDELLSVIINVYKEEIKPYLNDLKLHKMIDLIEIISISYEHYKEDLLKGDFKKCLRYYIVGLFYIYLIVPNSIQFQIKNKNYEFFISLKQMFEKDINMSNVKLQTVDYVGVLNEKFTNNHIEFLRSKSKLRSNTLPSSALQQDLSQLAKQAQELSLETNNLSPPSSSSSSTNSSIVEEELWSPPDLQPNDHLKLVSDNNFSSDSLAKIPELPSHAPPPPPPPALASQSQLPNGAQLQELPNNSLENGLPAPSQFKFNHAKTLPLEFQPITQYPPLQEPLQEPSVDEIPEEEYLKKRQARKGSYQSVYVNEDEDELNELPTISSKDLYEDLDSGKSFYLIIDLRRVKSFQINHIEYDHVLNIDPSNFIDVSDYQSLKDILKTILIEQDYIKFKNMKSFDSVIVYTDNKCFLESDFDYITKFRSLISSNVSIELLKGGFDSWLKYITKINQSHRVLKFKARRTPIQQPQPQIAVPPPPSVPPPSPPKQSASAPPYDYTKFLPQYQSSHEAQPSIPIDTNQTTSRSFNPPSNVPPPPPPHLTPYSRPQQAPPVPPDQYHQYQPPYNQSYQMNQHQQYSPAYPQQQYQSQQWYGQPSSQVPSQSQPNIMQSAPQLQSFQQSSQSQQQQQYQVSNRSRTDSIPTLQRSQNPMTRLSITGLRNLGNTCYINSMIQCLFASTQFRDIFLNKQFESYINPKFNKPKISPLIAALFKKMYLNGGCSVVPSGFLKICNQLRPDLKIPSEQQDTQEFLMFLLDQLHDELSNSNSVVNDFPGLMSYDSSLGEDYSKWTEGLIKQGLSPISEIFQGQLKDSLKCMTCGFESSNYSTFYMLSLVIPKINTFGKKLKKIQLEDCINLFTNEEILTGENAWDCPKCSEQHKKKSSNSNSNSLSIPSSSTTESTSSSSRDSRKHRLHFGNGFRFRSSRSSSPSKKPSSMSSKKSSSKSIKSLNFVKLPPILIIHLSRFLFYDLSTKDNSIVQYPLILEFNHEGTTIKYKLFGVVNHSGTLKSGHYTSITNKALGHNLQEPAWYYFDDEVVKTTDHGDIRNHSHLASSEVYVLYYERIY